MNDAIPPGNQLAISHGNIVNSLAVPFVDSMGQQSEGASEPVDFTLMSSEQFRIYWSQMPVEEAAEQIVSELENQYDIFVFSGNLITDNTPESQRLIEIVTGLSGEEVINRAHIRDGQIREVVNFYLGTLTGNIPDSLVRKLYEAINRNQQQEESPKLAIGLADAKEELLKGNERFVAGKGYVSDHQQLGVEYRNAVEQLERVKHPKGLREATKTKDRDEAFGDLLIYARNCFIKIGNIVGRKKLKSLSQLVSSIRTYGDVLSRDVNSPQDLPYAIGDILIQIRNSKPAELPSQINVSELNVLGSYLKRE